MNNIDKAFDKWAEKHPKLFATEIQNRLASTQSFEGGYKQSRIDLQQLFHIINGHLCEIMAGTIRRESITKLIDTIDTELKESE